MQERDDDIIPQKPRGIPVIAGWLSLSAVYIVYTLMQRDMWGHSAPTAGEWVYPVCAAILALGLFLKQEWGRKWTVVFFSLYFFWACWVVHCLSDASFDKIIELAIPPLAVPITVVRNALIIALVLYTLWPIIVVFYLTHPTVKEYFRAPPRPDYSRRTNVMKKVLVEDITEK